MVRHGEHAELGVTCSTPDPSPGECGHPQAESNPGEEVRPKPPKRAKDSTY